MSVALSARLLPNGGRFDCQPGRSIREAAQVAGHWPDLYDFSSVEEWQQRFPGVSIVPVLSAEAGRLAVATGISPRCGVGRPPADGDVEVFAAVTP